MRTIARLHQALLLCFNALIIVGAALPIPVMTYIGKLVSYAEHYGVVRAIEFDKKFRTKVSRLVLTKKSEWNAELLEVDLDNKFESPPVTVGQNKGGAHGGFRS